MHASNTTQGFGGKFFRLNVESGEPGGARIFIRSANDDGVGALFEKGLDAPQLIELAVLAQMATVVIGLNGFAPEIHGTDEQGELFSQTFKEHP